MYSSDDKLLFWDIDGHAARTTHIQGAVESVEGIPEERVSNDGADMLVAEIVQKYTVAVPILDTANITYSRSQQRESGRDNWGDNYDRMVDVMIFEVPFTGDRDLFLIRPGKWSSNPPRAKVALNALTITVRDTGDAAQIKAEIDATIEGVEEYLCWHRDFWKEVPSEIAREVKQRLQARRLKFETAKEADSGLAGFGFKPKS